MVDHVRFLHTADWQLGMRAHFLEAEAQHRFADARFEAIASVARLTRAHDAEFVLVAGDVFEYSQVDRRTIVRALDGLRAVPAPVFLLAGNHDPLGPGSVYARGDFRAACPDHVHVLQPGKPVRVRPGVEVLGAPWPSKRPGRDLVAEACAGLEPVTRGTRVLIAHGAVDALFPASADPARISLAAAERALADGRVSYLALGDRHSLTQVGTSGRIWYAGAPEPTDYVESDAGRVLLVDLSAEACTVSPQSVGSWHFVRQRLDLDATHGPATVRSWLDDLPDKRRTLVRLGLTGSLSLRADAELRAVLAEAEDVFAHVGLWPRHTDLALLPDEADLGELGLSGFAGEAVKRLTAEAGGPQPQSPLAREALALLHRLVVSAP